MSESEREFELETLNAGLGVYEKTIEKLSSEQQKLTNLITYLLRFMGCFFIFVLIFLFQIHADSVQSTKDLASAYSSAHDAVSSLVPTHPLKESKSISPATPVQDFKPLIKNLPASIDIDLIELDRKIEDWSNSHIKYVRGYMGKEENMHMVFRALPQVENKCGGFSTFGKGDGMKYYCADDPFPNDCVVLSIGSSGDYSFELDIIKETPCEVHTFDCTGNFPAPKGQNRIIWHKKCLGDPNHGGDYLTYEGALETIRPGNFVPYFLKMDIEGFEFEVMRHVLRTSLKERLPEQISFELHALTNIELLLWAGRYKSSLEIYSFMNLLQEYGKYKLIHRDDNDGCGHCTELLVKRFPDADFATFTGLSDLFEPVL